MSSTAFSSDDVQVISRQIETAFPLERPGRGRKKEDLEKYYETSRCVAFIQSNPKFQRVALQFPDFLLPDAVELTLLLKEKTGRDVVILGDTSYGSCCVDEVAADHVQADCIIHFGPACLTQTRSLPVLYVFGHEGVNTPECVEAFRHLFPDRTTHILVLYDTVYAHCIDEFENHLGDDYPNCIISRLALPDPVHAASQVTHTCQTSSECSCSCFQKDKQHNEEDTVHGALPACEDNVKPVQHSEVGSVLPDRHKQQQTGTLSSEEGVESQTYVTHKRFGRSFELAKPIEEYCMFYIGIEGPTLSNLMLNYSKIQFYSYNPLTRESRKETLNVNRALGKRYYLVQKAKEARTVGILVGTLGAAEYLEIIERLKKILKQAGKKYYTIAVGKLNVPKLANFMEIDVYVLVACPENSLVESQEFYKPVVTPFEMEVACIRSRKWTGDFITDYQELFPGAAFHVAIDEDTSDIEPEFSLITGGLLPSPAAANEEDQLDSSDTLVLRPKMEVSLPSTGAGYLQTRSWQGLEQKLGDSEVHKAIEGRSGIAASYTHEDGHQKQNT